MRLASLRQEWASDFAKAFMTESTAPTKPLPDASLAPHADHGWITQLVVLSVAGVCFALVWYAGILFHVPAHRGFEASLLQQPGFGGKLLAILAAVLLPLACGLIGQLIAGRHWVFAGPFAAAISLSALSMRGGPSRYVYFQAASAGHLRSVPLALALELILLVVAVGAVWLLVTRRARAMAVAAGEGVPLATPLTAASAQAVLTQAAIMALVVMILAQTDHKKQVLLSAFVGAFAGTAVAEHYFRRENAGEWFWMGPLVVGLLGYLGAAAFGSAASAMTGHITGPLAALARPLPLDYASFGVAGALLGYWAAADHAWLHRATMTRVFGRGPASAHTAPEPVAPSPPERAPPASANGQAG